MSLARLPIPPAAARAAVAAMVLLGAYWAFAPALHGTWLWDDDQYVTQNPLLRSGAGLLDIWLGRTGVNYFPLTSTVWWIEWRLWGLDPVGYHWVNLALQAASAGLIWRLAGALQRRPGAAPWIAALLFAVHPLAVESVAWIAELKNTLSLALALLSMLAFVRGRPRSATAWFVLALLAKTTVAMLPAIFLLYSWWRHGRVRRQDVLASLPGFAASAALGCVTLALERSRAIGIGETPLEPFAARLFAAPRIVCFYLGHALWPARLLPIYPRWSLGFGAWAAWLGWAALAAVAAAGWMRRNGWGRHVLFGLGAFVLSLLPTMALVPMAYLRLAWTADHFAYLALASLAVSAGFALTAAARRFAPAAAVVLAFALAVRSRAYSRAFRSPEALWTRTLEGNPGAWSAHNDLGAIRYDQGRLDDAVAEFRAATRLNPRYAEAFNNLGVALAQSGRWPEALAAYRRALALKPRYADAACNFGNALLQTGRAEAAVAAYRDALDWKQPFPEARYNLGLALRALGREDEARAQFAASGHPAPP